MDISAETDFNTSQSISDEDLNDDEDSRDAALAIEENLLKDDNQQNSDNNDKNLSFSDQIDSIKQEEISIEHDIILPQASLQKQTSVEHKEKKKEKENVKSRKELEEEERERMQSSKIDDWVNDNFDKTLIKKCDELLHSYQMSQEKIAEISIKSVGQHGNEIYDTYRSKRLTASMFGTICKRRPETSCDSQVRQCLYPIKFTNKYVEYGKNNEIVAIKMFEKEKGLRVNPSGIYIDKELGFLGASPDGLIEAENSIVEVKCTLSLVEKNLSFKEAAMKLSYFCLKYENDKNSVSLKRDHQYFYQIQGQLHITKCDKCYFIVFRDKCSPLHIEIIERDDNFWKFKMEPHLSRFFKTCILPEIILKRAERGLKCLDPDWIEEAQMAKLADQIEKMFL